MNRFQRIRLLILLLAIGSILGAQTLEFKMEDSSSASLVIEAAYMIIDHDASHNFENDVLNTLETRGLVYEMAENELFNIYGKLYSLNDLSKDELKYLYNLGATSKKILVVAVPASTEISSSSFDLLLEKAHQKAELMLEGSKFKITELISVEELNCQNDILGIEESFTFNLSSMIRWDQELNFSKIEQNDIYEVEVNQYCTFKFKYTFEEN